VRQAFGLYALDMLKVLDGTTFTQSSTSTPRVPPTPPSGRI